MLHTYSTSNAHRRANARYRVAKSAEISIQRKSYYQLNKEKFKVAGQVQYTKKKKAKLLAKITTALAGIEFPGRNKAEPEVVAEAEVVEI